MISLVRFHRIPARQVLTQLLASSFLASTALLGAQQPPALESFESGVPSQWKSGGLGGLSVTTERYKSGEHSLEWKWGAGNSTLEYSDSSPLRTLNENHRMVIWVYNETPIQAPMHADLLHQGKVVAKIWFWMDYQGWAPLGAPYNATGLKPGQRVDTIRLHAIEGIESGKLFIDAVQLDEEGIPAYRNLTPYQTPWLGVENGLSRKPADMAFSVSHPSRNRPWLPKPKAAADITDKERADMEKLTRRLLPAISRPAKGLDGRTMDDLRKQFTDMRIVRNGDRITGRPISNDAEVTFPDAINFWDYLRFCNKVENAYKNANKPADLTELRQMFIDLSAHLLDQGWREGTSIRHFSNYPLASNNSFFFMRDILAEAGLATDIARMFAWTIACQGSSSIYLNENSFASMDGLGFWSNQLLPNVLMIPEETERLHRIRCIQRFYNNTLVNNETIGPDGCAYHHGTFHFAYANYSLPRILRVFTKLADTDFRIGKAAHERLKAYCKSLSFTFTGGAQPYNISARAPISLKGNMSDFAVQLAQLGTPDGSQGVDPEMISLAYSEALWLEPEKREKALDEEPLKTWISEGAKPTVHTGFLPMNGSPIAIYRRPGWLVGISGMSKYWLGLEIYGWTQHNNYGRFARNGSICVISNGNPPNLAESGWNADGWNWSHFPGSTALQLPSADIFEGYAKLGNSSAIVGGTVLGENGIWGMDYTGGNGIDFRKSVFCFDNRITVITSGIHSEVDAPAVTTLFQNHLQPGRDRISLGDGSVIKLGESRSGKSDAAQWFIDNQEIGYLIPAGQPLLRLQCAAQQWTYLTKGHLKDPENNPFPTNLEYRHWQHNVKKAAELEKYYNPSKGDFAFGYFEHGIKPADASCAYTMVIKTDSEKMKALATGSPIEILRQDNTVHAVRDIAADTTGYILFAANKAIAPVGLLRSNDQPCFLMIGKRGTDLALSLVRPDQDRKDPVTLVLDGSWKLKGAAVDGIQAEISGKTTILHLTPDHYMPLAINLQPAG